MSKTSRALIFLTLAVIVAVVVGSQCSRRPRALAKYKGELRAKGEKLTWAEMGYPLPAETNKSVERLLAAVAQLPATAVDPGGLVHMPFDGPGRAQPAWALSEPRFNSSSRATNSLTWVELDDAMQNASDALAEIRSAMENPARYFWLNPEDFLNWPGGSFVQKRKVAQWLAADAINASRIGESARAQADLHAMIQLTQLHRDECTLVAQMIRVALAGLALNTTWEVLQTNGWNETTLTALQADWEQVDLPTAINRGIVGERAHGEAVFAWLRRATGRESLKLVQISPVARGLPALKSFRDYFSAYVEQPLWRMNSEEDELFCLQHYQRCLDSLRQLDGPKPWPDIAAELNAHNDKINEIADSILARIRYQLTCLVIPNTAKATLSAVRHETQRRLTVVAIALERYRLQHGSAPPEMTALVPEFLSAVPRDLMSVEPLRYRLNPDGSFVLYSVGEDGQDNGGEASASSIITNKFDFWSGKDAVWPTAVISNP